MSSHPQLLTVFLNLNLSLNLFRMFFVALTIIPIIAMFFYRRPLYLLYLWPVMILISVIFVESTVEMEGITRLPVMFLPMDTVYAFTIIHLGLYAILQPKRFWSLLKENPFLSLFLGMVTLYIVIYTPIHGKTAIGEARKYYFFFLFPLLALITIRNFEDLRRFVLIVVLAAGCLSIIAVAQAAMTGSIVRILTSSQTLIVAFAMFTLIIHRIHKVVMISSRVDTGLLLLFSILVIWSGHRTVWLAICLGILLLAVLYRARSTIIAKTVLILVGSLLSLTLALAAFPRAGDRIVKGFEGILNPQADGTASWRIESWRQHLDRLYRQGNLLFGEGLGTYYVWQFEGRRVHASPHSAYIQAILKFGLVGMTMYVLLALKFFRRMLRVRRMLRSGQAKAYIDLGIVNFGAGHAYALGYGFDATMLVFFAVALTTATLSEKSRTTAAGVYLSRLVYADRRNQKVAPTIPPLRPRVA